jgi:hypothetical protein
MLLFHGVDPHTYRHTGIRTPPGKVNAQTGILVILTLSARERARKRERKRTRVGYYVFKALK